MGALAVLGVGAKKGEAFAELAVLDRSGKVMFYDVKMDLNYHLTDCEDVVKVTSELVGDMRTAGPQ